MGHEDLKVWHRAMELAVESCRVAAMLPAEERFALGNQIRRSAVSVAANIAEGHARSHVGDCLYLLSVASGSLAELQTLLRLCTALDYVPPDRLATPLALSTETSRMLSSLRRALRRRPHPLHTPRPHP